MTPDTHLKINHRLCGEPVSLSEGEAVTRFATTVEMNTDDHGLVHGGFVFGLADYAAMLAVNHPHVVLAGAEVKFTAPVKVGEVVEAHAKRLEQKGRKHIVEVSAKVGEREVFKGTFTTVVLEKHVLDG